MFLLVWIYFLLLSATMTWGSPLKIPIVPNNIFINILFDIPTENETAKCCMYMRESISGHCCVRHIRVSRCIAVQNAWSKYAERRKTTTKTQCQKMWLCFVLLCFAWCIYLFRRKLNVKQNAESVFYFIL